MWFFPQRRERERREKNQLFWGKAVPRSVARDLTHLTHQTRMPRVEIIVALCVAWLPCCALASANHSPDSLCAFFILLLSRGVGCWFWMCFCFVAHSARCVPNKQRLPNVHRAYTVVSIVLLIRFIIPFYSTFVYLLQPRFIWFDVSANRLLLLLWIWIEEKIFVYVCECDVWWLCSV